MIHQYTPKFDYKPISRQTVDGARRYATPDGLKLPSVTTILDSTKTEESKNALMQWKNRVGEKQAQAITTEAANRGTRLHSYLETYVKTGSMGDRTSNPFSWPSHAMAHEIVNKGLVKVDEFWGTEINLYFSGIYAGTTDCCGVHQGKQAIIDFKQSNKTKKREWIEDYFLQLVAYGEAHNNMFETSIEKGVIMMAVKPDLDKDGLMIGKPEYLEFIIDGDEYEHYRSKWWKRVEQYYIKHG